MLRNGWRRLASIAAAAGSGTTRTYFSVFVLFGIVQTFTFEGDPRGVALETLRFEDLGDGRTRLRTQSLAGSFEGRDAWLHSGVEAGVDEGYAKLDRMLADGAAGAARPGGPGRWPGFSPNGSAVPAPGTRHPRSRAGPPATWFVT